MPVTDNGRAAGSDGPLLRRACLSRMRRATSPRYSPEICFSNSPLPAPGWGAMSLVPAQEAGAVSAQSGAAHALLCSTGAVTQAPCTGLASGGPQSRRPGSRAPPTGVRAAEVHPQVLLAGGQQRRPEVAPLAVHHHVRRAPAVAGRQLADGLGPLQVGAVGACAWGGRGVGSAPAERPLERRAGGWTRGLDPMTAPRAAQQAPDAALRTTGAPQWATQAPSSPAKPMARAAHSAGPPHLCPG